MNTWVSVAGANDAWVAAPGASFVLHWKDGQPADGWLAAKPRSDAARALAAQTTTT